VFLTLADLKRRLKLISTSNCPFKCLSKTELWSEFVHLLAINKLKNLSCKTA